MTSPPTPDKKQVRSFPVILSVADGFEWCANELERMRTDLGLFAFIYNIAKDKSDVPFPPDLMRIGRDIVDADAQKAGLKATIAELRKLAIEHRTLDMKELTILRSKQRDETPSR